MSGKGLCLEGVMYGGGFVRRGFCPEGVLSAHRQTVMGVKRDLEGQGAEEGMRRKDGGEWDI